MFKQLFRTGVTPDMNSYLRVKIILSNQVAIIMSAVELVYGTTAWLYFPVLVPLYGVGLCCTVLVFLLNYFRLFTLSRLMVAVFPTLLSGLTYFAVSQGSQGVVTEILLVTFGMMICPFMMFDSRESGYRNLAFLLCSVVFINNILLNEWIDIKMDAWILKTTPFIYFNLTVAVAVMFAFLAVLQSTNKRAEDKNRQLLEKMEETRLEMEEKSRSLEDTLKEVEKARQQDAQRNWAATGIAQFSTLLREAHEPEELYNRLTAGIVKYLKANQGSLFLSQTDEAGQPCLQLAACYAYDKKKYTEKTIYPGQGLVGQCYLEKQKILLKRVPDDYIRITSGLGDANPSCILIIPMLANDEVEGIFEIASFQVFESHEIDFLEKLGEGVAAALRNNKTSLHTRKLLEETRLQAQEMKAQEEEMRQNMEELLATQEEMQRKEWEMQEKFKSFSQAGEDDF